jgi:uncharacterized integral membrane protein
MEPFMTFRALLLALAFLLLAAFTLMNWGAFLAPTTLSLGVADVQAPLGLVMLGFTAVLSGLFLVYILVQQATIILESRRMAKDLQAQRELADKAEASRFTEMRGFIDAEFRRLEARSAAATLELREALQRLEQQLGARLDESTRTLSAYVGEVEDKIDRVLPPPRV